MARAGRRKKATAKSRLNPLVTSRDGEDAAYQFQDRQKAFNHREVEVRISAIQAIQMAEVHTTLACLRVLRSYLSEEQLQTSALKFFQENLPNLLVVRNVERKIFELRRIDENCSGNELNLFLNAAGDLHCSKESANLQIPDFGSCVTALDGVSDAQMSRMSGVGDMFQTPGGTSNRLSFGLTPKTSRLPKQGEMLLSIHGSPLGVFKEDHLEAIHESEDGSQPASSG
ncbi:hypothetical protein KSP39_PZI013583 [Platanthera zijinensis]|uniref:Uncharacterized protein n=1 Tax=Platanthera zijinensis TaxID=2320716 RepID=A0AAP0G352_9ASPA